MVLEIFFAAGCFWGVEKNFEQIEGVYNVVSGYSGGNYENPTYRDVLENRSLKGGGFLEVLRNLPGSSEDTEVDEILVNHTETVKVVYDPEVVSTHYLGFLIPSLLVDVTYLLEGKLLSDCTSLIVQHVTVWSYLADIDAIWHHL